MIHELLTLFNCERPDSFFDLEGNFLTLDSLERAASTLFDKKPRTPIFVFTHGLHIDSLRCQGIPLQVLHQEYPELGGELRMMRLASELPFIIAENTRQRLDTIWLVCEDKVCVMNNAREKAFDILFDNAGAK